MSCLDLRIDVSAAVPANVSGGEKQELAVWVFIPEAVHTLAPATRVVTLLAGGTYDRRYYHFEVPGHGPYSMAQYLADAGNIVLVIDHLGVGLSSRPAHPNGATREVVAGATHAAVTQICERLQSGTLSAQCPPLEPLLRIGMGHSMGGMLLVTGQSQWATYDRIAVLGYTVAGVHLHLGERLVPAEDIMKTLGTQAAGDTSSYVRNDRTALRRTFHWEDVPDAVLAVDDSMLVDVPKVISLEALTRSVIRADAARISCPVFIGLGERDVSPAPYQEPSYYHGSRDVTLFILPRSGHCHSFASTRLQLYDRLLGWIDDTSTSN